MSTLNEKIERITQDYIKRMNAIGMEVDIAVLVEKESKKMHFFYEETNLPRITIEVSQLIDQLDLVKVRDEWIKNGIPPTI